MRLIDVSHTIEAGMITYKGLPAPIMCDFLSREASRKNYADGHEFVRGGEWQRFQQGRIDHAEDGRVGADPEREREDSDDGERRMLDELAKAVADVV